MTLPAICCVTEGVCSARQDTQHSDAGNVPLDELKKTFKGQGRASRPTHNAGCCLLCLRRYFNVFFSTAALQFVFFLFLAAPSWFFAAAWNCGGDYLSPASAAKNRIADAVEFRAYSA
jgi:hypothetical protein